jgi:Uma2 family endonuclease
MSVETKLMTADELLAMPDDGSRVYELVRGELVSMSPAGADHGDISVIITASLSHFVRKRRLGKVYSSDTGFVLGRNPDTVRQPDVSFVSAARVVKTEKYVPVPPDLVVEVISPNDSYSSVETKVEEYLAAGSQMVIVINPRNQTATATTRGGITKLSIDDTITGGDVVPGWSIPMRELFED